MKAIVAREYGGPEVLHVEEVPTPSPGAGQVLVRVHAVSVNRSLDLDIRAGTYKEIYGTVLPMILGVDPSGEIVSVGEGVQDFKAGDRVATRSHTQMFACGSCAKCLAGSPAECTNKRTLGLHRWGGYAEYVVIPITHLVRVPDGLSFDQATVIMRHAPTSLAEIKRAELKPGESVLVMAAAGALGSMLVQVCKQMGCTVIAASGSDPRVEFACSLGADYGVNYRAKDLEQEVMRITNGRGVDVVFENVGDPQLWPGAFNSLAQGGRLSTMGAHGGDFVTLHLRRLYLRGISILGGVPRLNQADYASLMQMGLAGELRAVIDRVMPLSEAAHAHELVAQHEPVGKVILHPIPD